MLDALRERRGLVEQRNGVNLQDLKEIVNNGKGNILGHAIGNAILGSISGGVVEPKAGKAYTDGGFREG